jgi:hypothetical protein
MGYHQFTNPFNGSLGSYIVMSRMTTLFIRCKVTVTTATSIYLYIQCGPGNSNSTNILNTPTYLNYIRIA